MDCNVSKAERAAWLREKLRRVEAYKYPLLVLLLGAGLLLLPRAGGSQLAAEPETAAAAAEAEPAALEAKLENLLSQMEGLSLLLIQRIQPCGQIVEIDGQVIQGLLLKRNIGQGQACTPGQILGTPQGNRVGI